MGGKQWCQRFILRIMNGRELIRFGALVFFATLSPIFAQPQSLTCGNNRVSQEFPAPTGQMRIHIVGVEFQGEDPLPDSERARLVNEIQKEILYVPVEQPESGWIDNLLRPIKDATQVRGFFQTKVAGTPHLVCAGVDEKRYIVTVAIESGPLYRLGKIRFENANPDIKSLAFSQENLRQLVPLNEGEICDTAKLRDALAAITRLYGSKGFIDATVEPDFDINGETQQIDFVIKVDEQQTFRIGKIETAGIDEELLAKFEFPQKSGEVFNSELWDSFFTANEFRPNSSASRERNVEIRRNTKSATLDIVLVPSPTAKDNSADE
jgi:outer membrane protein assembly factor BamA